MNDKNENQNVRTEYCKRCKRQTTHRTIGKGSDNTELECLECGKRKFLMQGFNYDLM